MASEPLDERYLTWLHTQVVLVKAKVRRRTFWSLLTQLHDTIFVAIIDHDENRIADAKDLRHEFLAEYQNEQGSLEWIQAPCSMLELLIVLARQLSFEMDDSTEAWFWHLIEVLELESFNDAEYDSHSCEAIAMVLERLIWRNYKPSGQGGLFPLNNPTRDQRKVELWYQLNAYLLELF